MRRKIKQSAHTLAGTMVFLMLVTALWLGVLRQMVSGLCVEKAFQKRLVFSEGSTRAAAWGLALLETGLPPEDYYACLVDFNTDPNVSTLEAMFVITFSKDDDLLYDIEVRPATEDDLGLPASPNTFGTTALSEILLEAINVINGLEDSMFNSSDSKDLLVEKVNNAIEKINDEQYTSALNKLQNDVLKRIDGCIEGDGPDSNDWLTTYQGQKSVYPTIITAIELLEELVSQS